MHPSIQAVINTPIPLIYTLSSPFPSSLRIGISSPSSLTSLGGHCRNIPPIAMGTCSSCEATNVAPITTAKLILPNGELREFAGPVKASHALRKDVEFFVCDADEMEFGEFVSAVPADMELQLGQIYFVLPRSMLRRPLQSEDLATLAVKASSALMRAAPGRQNPLVFSETRSEPAETKVDRRRRGRSGGTGRSFDSNLSLILE